MAVRIITVKRISLPTKLLTDNQSLSMIYLDDVFFGYGMEQPWNNNTPFKSCVPVGTYNLKEFNSTKYGKTFCLYNPQLGVTEQPSEDTYLGHNRYACLFHSANYANQLQGCIAFGETFKKLSADQLMIIKSRKMVNILLGLIDESTTVNIINEDDFE